jgi:anti-sigma B factor antagonist
MVLSITTRKCNGDISVVELAGRITLGRESGQIETTLVRLLDEGATRFVIDLAKIDYLDSTGIGRIAYCYGKITQAGAQARISGAKGLVMDLFRITRLDSVIRFFPDAESACASLEPTAGDSPRAA